MTSATDETSLRQVLDQAIAFIHESERAPNSTETVQQLLAAEKATRAERVPIALAQLTGIWRLTFITGTKRSRQTAGVALGAGRFLPRWIKIAIAYQADRTSPSLSEPAQANSASSTNAVSPLEHPAMTGTVDNRVQFAGVDLTVSGPIRLYPQKRILAFDFIKVHFLLGGIRLFKGYVKGGEARERSFAQKSIRDQAFFTYFLVEENVIAARGRGGGLAIWVREPGPEV